MNWKDLSKKQQQNFMRLGLLALLGICLLLAGGRGQQAQYSDDTQQLDSATEAAATQPYRSSTVTALEKQLAQTLSQIEGAGAVTVQIMIKDAGRKEYACDVQKTERNTSETSGDSQQQTTEVQENRTVVQQSGTGALLLAETMPEISGVLIVASGAGQASVQEKLLLAASTVLQLSCEKIAVLPGKGGVSGAGVR